MRAVATPSKPVPPDVLRVLAVAVEAYHAYDLQVRRALNPDAQPGGGPLLSPKGIQALIESRQARQAVAARADAPRTLQDFLRELDESDTTLTDWSRKGGFSHAVVASVVCGSCLGTRGQGREVMLAMGLMPPTVTSRFKLLREAQA